MPSYKCSRFNRDANVPSRICIDCGQLVKPISHGKQFFCQKHGITRKVQVCDCEGCQKSYEIRYKSDLRKRPWNTRGHSLERPYSQEYLRAMKKDKRIRDRHGLARHVCPKCKKSTTCSEPFRLQPNCGEIFKPKGLYGHCPVNQALKEGQERPEWLYRGCGGFWPSNPFTKDEELQDHIFYFHDASRINLAREVKQRPREHKCQFIRHKCVYCNTEWETKERMLPFHSAYKRKFYLGTWGMN